MIPKIILGLDSCSVLKRATNFERESEGKLDKSRCGEKRGLWIQKKLFRVRGRLREGEMKKGDIVEGGGCQSVLCPPPAYFPIGSSKRKVGENRKNFKGSRIFLPFSPSSPVCL